MENIVHNPPNYKSQYLQHLNKCFSNWGGSTEYEWVFDRKIGEFSSDIMLIENAEDGVIAGSAVSYRTLSNAKENIEIGIMTGSWTLPAARKKGCFGKMINTSSELCRKKSVPYLTAFVTETNPSCRGLSSAGSYMFPTYHLFSPEELFPGAAAAGELPKSPENNEKIFQRFQKHQSEYLSFKYNFEEFVGQFINRPKKPIIINIGEDFAVLEVGNNEMKILLLTFEDLDQFRSNIKSVTNWCLEHKNKKAFYFSTREEIKNICLEEGFSNLPGFFTILKNDTSSEENSIQEKFDSLNINMGDKM